MWKETKHCKIITYHFFIWHKCNANFPLWKYVWAAVFTPEPLPHAHEASKTMHPWVTASVHKLRISSHERKLLMQIDPDNDNNVRYSREPTGAHNIGWMRLFFKVHIEPLGPRILSSGHRPSQKWGSNNASYFTSTSSQTNLGVVGTLLFLNETVLSQKCLK